MVRHLRSRSYRTRPTVFGQEHLWTIMHSDISGRADLQDGGASRQCRRKTYQAHSRTRHREELRHAVCQTKPRMWKLDVHDLSVCSSPARTLASRRAAPRLGQANRDFDRPGGRTIRSFRLSKESSNIINDLFISARSGCAAMATLAKGLDASRYEAKSPLDCKSIQTKTQNKRSPRNVDENQQDKIRVSELKLHISNL